MQAFDVSVIVPSYNGAAWIEGALRSILDQLDFSVKEVIVIDDVSSDDTVNRVKRIGDPRIRIIQNSVNIGVAAARNVGLAAATSTWIAFNDQDDVWLPEKLRMQVSLLASCPNADAIVGGEARLSADGRTQWIGRLGPLRWVPQHLPLLKSPPVYDPSTDHGVYLQTLMARRTALTQIGGFKTDLPLADDSDLILRLTENCLVVAVDAPVFLYRLGDHNQTAPGVVKAKTFIAARSYVNYAASERRAGKEDPSPTEYMREFEPSAIEVRDHLLNQEMRMVNTVWVNRGLTAAIIHFFSRALLHPGAVGYVADRLRRLR